MPRPLQIAFRRQLVSYKRRRYSHVWPIDHGAGAPPEKWAGWPHNKKFALVLSHDVDTQKGCEHARRLMHLEKTMGVASLFNFVPERYPESLGLRDDLSANGFEVGVHGLKHDGRLFWSKKVFKRRAVRINHYLNKWNTRGFTSPSTHHNLAWMHALEIDYDISTFDTDPFEPQPDGVGTIFPFWVNNPEGDTGYVEFPLTLPQDHTLFIMMRESNIDIWKQKLDWIAEKGGMALLNTHPDYMQFNDRTCNGEEYPVKYYEAFLHYVKTHYQGQFWHVLPRDMARFWKAREAFHHGGTEDTEKREK